MVEPVNDLSLHCPNCANQDIVPSHVTVALLDPPTKVEIEEKSIIVERDADMDERGKVTVRMECGKCGQSSWAGIYYESGEVIFRVSKQDEADA